MRQDKYELGLRFARWDWFFRLLALLVGLYTCYVLLIAWNTYPGPGLTEKEQRLYVNAAQVWQSYEETDSKQKACAVTQDYNCALYWKEEARELFTKAKKSFQEAEEEHSSWASKYFRVRKMCQHLRLALTGIPSSPLKENTLAVKELARRLRTRFQSSEMP